MEALYQPRVCSLAVALNLRSSVRRPDRRGEHLHVVGEQRRSLQSGCSDCEGPRRILLFRQY